MKKVGRRKNMQGWEEADSKREPGERRQCLWSVHLPHVWGLPSMAAWNFVASSARLSRLKLWTECPEHSCLCYWYHPMPFSVISQKSYVVDTRRRHRPMDRHFIGHLPFWQDRNPVYLWIQGPDFIQANQDKQSHWLHNLPNCHSSFKRVKDSPAVWQPARACLSRREARLVPGTTQIFTISCKNEQSVGEKPSCSFL